MKTPELESLLKRAQLPQIPEESLELFPRRIVARLKHRDRPVRARRSDWPRLAWAAGLVGCVAMAFFIAPPRPQRALETTQAKDTLASRKLISETLALFPNRLRAIVEDGHGVNLILSEAANVPTTTPIYVRICDGNHCSSLVTFSGQEIQIAGQMLTVLSEPDGGIILLGNQFVWSNSKPVDTGRNLKIEAKNIEINTL